LFQSLQMLSLTGQHRSVDPAHTEMLRLLRQAGAVDEVWEHVSFATEKLTDPAFAFPTVAVTSNAERRHINRCLLRRFAAHHGVPVLRWVRRLPPNRRSVFAGPHQEKLHRCPDIWDEVAEGAPMQMSENICAALGLANGTMCFFVKLLWSRDDEAAAREALSRPCDPGALINVPHPVYWLVDVPCLPDVELPAPLRCMLVTTARGTFLRVPVPANGARRGCVDSEVHLSHDFKVSASYFAARVAFAVTTWRLQGVSLASGLLVRLDDITRDCLAMLYVVFSRVTEGRLLRLVAESPWTARNRLSRKVWDADVAAFYQRCIALPS